VSLPKTVKVVIEDMFGKDQIIKVIRHNFLSQAMDLIHDHKIWGNKNNFIGTVNMDDPFDPFIHGRCDSSVDEVVDGTWYRETVTEFAKLLMESTSWYLA